MEHSHSDVADRMFLLDCVRRSAHAQITIPNPSPNKVHYIGNSHAHNAVYPRIRYVQRNVNLRVCVYIYIYISWKRRLSFGRLILVVDRVWIFGFIIHISHLHFRLAAIQ